MFSAMGTNKNLFKHILLGWLQKYAETINSAT